MKQENPMRIIKIKSVTLHCSTAIPKLLERYSKLLNFITKAKPILTLARKRIPTWKISPGLPIGCKVTIRKNTIELLKLLFTGISELKEKQFNPGFLTFGIKEYIEIPSLSFQRDIGILGFDVDVTLGRAGLRVNKRKRSRSKIPARHKITKAETVDFFKKNFGVEIV